MGGAESPGIKMRYQPKVEPTSTLCIQPQDDPIYTSDDSPSQPPVLLIPTDNHMLTV